MLRQVMSSRQNSESETSSVKVTLFKKYHYKTKNNGILKSKENIFKSKYHNNPTLLKNKLKKYKIRKDGFEDPDVIDVSRCFLLSLNINSPTKDSKSLHNINFDDFGSDEIKVTNYLFKMVNKKGKANDNSKTKITNGEDHIINKNIDSSHSQVANGLSVKVILDNKHKNAFQLMMGSRNKSIGSNSPGKVKKIEEKDSEEILIQKATKIKRSLVLQKMAEAKGKLQKEELEQYKDNFIKSKMDDRAKRLKNMLTTGATKSKKYTSYKEIKSHKKIVSLIETGDEVKIQNETMQNDTVVVDNCDLKVSKKIKDVCNILLENEFKPFNIPKKNQIHSEDDEFFKKLSPSLRKKDMLCYYNKVEKDLENSIFEDQEVNESKDNLNINIKLTRKNKKKTIKKKNCIKKIDENDNKEDSLNIKVNREITNKTNNKKNIENQCRENYDIDNNCDEGLNRKRKRKKINFSTEPEKVNTITSRTDREATECRPKRNANKPKYCNEVSISSSDDDFQIFTPKKKKSRDFKEKSTIKAQFLPKENNGSIKKIVTDSLKGKKSNKNVKSKKTKTIVTKLAPIFECKPQIDAAKLEAKQKFLQSGVPEQLKKIIENQSTKTTDLNNFFITTHVQQTESNNYNCKKLYIDYYSNEVNDNNDHNVLHSNCYTEMMPIECVKSKKICPSGFQSDVTLILHNIKQSYPEFPVYRTYRLLKNKYGKDKSSEKNDFNLDNNSEEVIGDKIEYPVHLTWTEKYRAASGQDIIGNFESIKELRKWLISWRENEVISRKKYCESDSDSSDFFYYSDTDSRDSMKAVNNFLIVTGPVGSGKTSSVYAVAAELSMKVIEVNASSRRSGKIILQDLQEATQSHKVNRILSSEFTQNSQDKMQDKVSKKNKLKPKKTYSKVKVIEKSKMNTKTYNNGEISSQTSICSQDASRTGMSLVLIDDADITFDQDDGFTSALSQIIQCSKRPVLLITSTLTCQHLQRFLHCGNIVKMNPLSPRILGTWLDIMCLAETGICWPGIGSKFLDLYHGDIRKAINYLQFIVTSQVNMDQQSNLQAVEYHKQAWSNVEDESSGLSWVDYNTNKENYKDEPSKILSYFNTDVNFSYSLKPSTLWWNISNLFNFTQTPGSEVIVDSGFDENTKSKRMLTLANVMDCISISDLVHHNNNSDGCITSDPWRLLVGHSMSENENFESYDKSFLSGNEISNELIKNSLLETQPFYVEEDIELSLPGADTLRERTKLHARHNMLTNSFSSGAILDRRALATDYWPMCRNICRIERDKIDSNSKRNNRFCHYLKSATVTCKNDSFEKLCDSLKS